MGIRLYEGYVDFARPNHLRIQEFGHYNSDQIYYVV